MPNHLEKGADAPPFHYRDAQGDSHFTADLKQPYLVYFYPKDNTPGCTAEACALRDSWDDYLEAGLAVIGVSFDTDDSHDKFRNKHDLPFGLASDADKAIAKAFGVYDSKRLTHKLLPFARRVSFLIDKEQKIYKCYTQVNPSRHASEVLEDARKLTL